MSDGSEREKPQPQSLLDGLLPPEQEAPVGSDEAPEGPAEGSEATAADVDPARAADIRGLAVALRAAQSAGAASAESAGTADLETLRIGHGERDDPSQVDIGVGSITDALALLPDPAEAQTPEERAAREAAIREAQARQVALARAAQRRPRKDDTEELSDLDLAADEVRPSRLKWVVGGLVGLLGVAALGTAYGLLARRADRARQEARRLAARYANQVDPLIAKQARAAAKAGLRVDPFAGLLARTPDAVRPTDVDAVDQALNQSVPELDRWFEQALRRMSKGRRRAQLAQRGAALVKLGEHRRGRKYLFRAIRIRDGVAERLALGRSFLAEKRFRAAIPHLKRALRISRRRTRTDAQLLLAQAYLGTGQRRAACALVRRARRRAREGKEMWQKHCGPSGGGR